MRTNPIPFKTCAARSLLLIIMVAGLCSIRSQPAGASIDLSLTPGEMFQQPGDTIQVELAIVNESDAFNAYDARVTYDPTRLRFLKMLPVSAQEGPLMTEGCAQRFHIFSIAPDSTYLQINHSLLCVGVSVTGPGVVYRLRFQCRSTGGPTYLGFGAPTAFYNDGIRLAPPNLQGAVVFIDAASSAPEVSPTGVGLSIVPNPFGERTTLTIDLGRPGEARFSIYDLSGRLLRTLFDSQQSSGRHQVTWSGSDGAGRGVAAGTYFAIVEANGLRLARRIVCMK